MPTRSTGVMSCDCQPTAAVAVSAGAAGSGVDGVRVLVRVDARRSAVDTGELRRGAASVGRRSSSNRGIDQGGSILSGSGVWVSSLRSVLQGGSGAGGLNGIPMGRRWVGARGGARVCINWGGFWYFGRSGGGLISRSRRLVVRPQRLLPGPRQMRLGGGTGGDRWWGHNSLSSIPTRPLARPPARPMRIENSRYAIP